MEAHPQIFTTTTATLTDSRGTWLVGHACGRDAAAAAAAAASPPHVSEFGGACVCVCVCVCVGVGVGVCVCVGVCGWVWVCVGVCVGVQHALMLMRRRGVEGRSGDMVAACLCLSLAAFTTTTTTICMSLVHCTHMHARWLSTLNAVHSLPHLSLCCRFSSPSSHLLPSLVTQCRCLLVGRSLTCAATPPRLCKQARWRIVSMCGVS